MIQEQTEAEQGGISYHPFQCEFRPIFTLCGRRTWLHSECQQELSRSCCSQAQDRGNQVLPAGAVELLALDCFLSHQQDAVGPVLRKGSGCWLMASNLAAANISHALCAWE